jgi:hypothetical protein
MEILRRLNGREMPIDGYARSSGDDNTVAGNSTAGHAMHNASDAAIDSVLDELQSNGGWSRAFRS